MATETLYLRADEIKPGDILPDVSHKPVTSAHKLKTDDGHGSIRFRMGAFVRDARYGGAEYGYECFRVERAAVESEEDYVRACDAQHAANLHRFEGEL